LAGGFGLAAGFGLVVVVGGRVVVVVAGGTVVVVVVAGGTVVVVVVVDVVLVVVMAAARRAPGATVVVVVVPLAVAAVPALPVTDASAGRADAERRTTVTPTAPTTAAARRGERDIKLQPSARQRAGQVYRPRHQNAISARH
jgi:hypothetical protein